MQNPHTDDWRPTPKRPVPREVFVGNIAYETTEEQLEEVFREVGPVVKFRLIFDRHTGQSKGYGFCSFPDADTAQSAIRNLHGRSLNGRPLRVNRAGKKSDLNLPRSPDRYNRQWELSSQGRQQRQEAWNCEPDTIHTIDATLNNMGQAKIYEFVEAMQNLLKRDPTVARTLLDTHPSLCYTILQAQVRLDMISVERVENLVYSTQVPQQQPGLESRRHGGETCSQREHSARPRQRVAYGPFRPKPSVYV